MGVSSAWTESFYSVLYATLVCIADVGRLPEPAIPTIVAHGQIDLPNLRSRDSFNACHANEYRAQDEFGVMPVLG
jgi:hypothetical protein